MAHYGAKFIQCPFYHRHDNNKIVCEGLSKNNTLHLVFQDPISTKKYIDDHCKSIHSCQTCLIHKVMAEKWRSD